MSDYRTKFDEAVSAYPFPRWQQSGLAQYSEEACGAFAAVFDRLIQELVRAGEGASEQTKRDLFHQAVDALNALNEQDESLIETAEREDLCELVNRITVACGLDPSQYGVGEGLASEWREW